MLACAIFATRNQKRFRMAAGVAQPLRDSLCACYREPSHGATPSSMAGRLVYNKQERKIGSNRS